VARPPILKSTRVTSSRRVVLWPGSTKKPSGSRSTILKDIERDFYMTAQQALDYWIVDTIIKKYDRVVTPNSTSL
jgi:ATP-dependent protease ClpP protease subunit